MKNIPLRKKPKASECGFALVVTIILLMLLSLLVVGLLGLSSVTLRNSAVNSAQIEAKANARLALMIAIGQLQQLAGQDTRITAGSDLVDESDVRATGVWRSWEGTDRDSEGKPVAPDYSLKTQAGDPKNPLGSSSEGRFLGWLASPMAGLEPEAGTLTGLFVFPGSSTVPLVASGSVRDAAEQVHATPTLVDLGERQGAYAWWVSGENQKAMLNVDSVDPPDTVVGWHTRIKSNGKADAQSFGLGGLDELPITVSLPSTDSLELVEPDEPPADLRKFHHLTAFNSGLLTNSASGGWRKDLSLFSENFAALPATELPSFTIKPGQIQTASKAAEQNAKGNHPPNALLYPWAKYRTNGVQGGRASWSHTPPVCSWTALADFMLQYRRLTSTSATRTIMPVMASGLELKTWRYEYLEQVRRAPIIARVQWIFSLCSRQKSDPADPSNTHQAAFLLTPVVTLWNPYNVELRMDDNFYTHFDQIAPLSFTFKVGDRIFKDITLNQIFKTSDNQAGWKVGFRMDIRMPGGAPIILAPGATRIFGVNNPVPVEDAIAAVKQKANIILEPGYRPNGGLLFYGLNQGKDVYGKASDTFAVEEYGYSGKVNNDKGSGGLGVNWEVFINTDLANGTKNRHGYRTVYPESLLAGGKDMVDELYPSPGEVISVSLQSVEGIRNKPFASATLGMKLATPRPRNSKFDNLNTKGMLNNHPFRLYTELGDKATGLQGTGIYHPANSPYDFSFQDVNSWNDTQAIPQFDPQSNSGYIVSGLTAGDGLTRCVVAELPTRPVQSLAELQHFDATNNKPYPPFQFNLIGNGSANPIFAPDQIRVNKTHPSQNNQYFCNDDTYILNHLLFDDWFVSSIAQDPMDFSASEERPIEYVYRDHLNAEYRIPLPNRFYLPAPNADPDFPVTSVSPNPDTEMYSYETVASQLEVRGMINVNSVSVEAWESWLRQGRDVRVPYLTADGSTQLDNEQSFAFPRTSIAGDRAAGSGSNASNPLFPHADEFAGYRALTETQVKALAEEIVEEIRKRGPFLSLAEFVNRRLTTDKSLAAASAIQQALDTLAQESSSAKNPFLTLQKNSVEITAPQPGETDHRFPEVALGSSAFGAPGWIRQADILTRLAPMLSVRDDTFTIRTYGDSRDRNGKIIARAWCEATVCRNADYVDPTDRSQINPHSKTMQSELNRRFGRSFEIVSFRWLHPSEI